MTQKSLLILLIFFMKFFGPKIYQYLKTKMCQYSIYIYAGYMRVSLSAEGAKNISWPWLSLLRGWGSLTMTSTGKFVYMAHHFIFLRLNSFGLRVDRKGWWFEHSVS